MMVSTFEGELVLKLLNRNRNKGSPKVVLKDIAGYNIL